MEEAEEISEFLKMVWSYEGGPGVKKCLRNPFLDSISMCVRADNGPWCYLLAYVWLDECLPSRIKAVEIDMLYNRVVQNTHSLAHLYISLSLSSRIKGVVHPKMYILCLVKLGSPIIICLEKSSWMVNITFCFPQKIESVYCLLIEQVTHLINTSSSSSFCSNYNAVTCYNISHAASSGLKVCTKPF